MRIAHNPQTGEYLGLQGGEWKPLRTASNAKGEKLYLDVDGWKPLKAGNAETPDSPKREDSVFWRGFSFGTRNVLEGLGSLPHMLLNEPINAIFGTNLKNPGEAIADLAGLEKAKTDSDRLLGAAVRGGVEALPAIFAGGAPAVAKALPRVSSFLAAAPLTQAAGGAASGAAVEGVRQAGGGTAAQVAAGLGAGLVPPVLSLGSIGAVRTAKAGSRALEALSEGGQHRIAGENLRSMASHPEELVRKLENMEGEIVPGSRPTLGQVAEDAGLATAEKGRRNRTPAFTEREAEQNAARQADLEKSADNLSPMSAYDTPDADRGAALRDVYESRYAAQKQAVTDAYNKVKEEPASFNLAPLRASFEDALPKSRYAQKMPAPIREFLAVMDDDIQNGVLGTYDDLQAMRTTLTEIAFEAGQKGERALASTANSMKSRLDDYLETAAQYADEAVAPLPDSATYRAARREATELAKAKVAADSPMWDQVWGHLDADSLFRDFPDAKRELSQLHGRGLFARKGEGLPIDQLADSLKTQGWLTPDADSSTLVEILKSKVRGKGRAAEEMGNVLEGMTQYGSGFTPEQAAAFNRAKAMRREQGQLFESDFNERMSRGLLRDDQIPSNYFKAGPAGNAAAKDFLRAFGDDPTARSVMREHVVRLFRKAALGQDGKVNLSRMQKWMTAHADALSVFPELRRELQTIVDRMTADIGRTRTMDALSSVRGSPTAQNLATQAIMDSMLGRSLGRGSEGMAKAGIKGMLAGGANRLTQALYGPADARINQLIDEAFLDPTFALKLLKEYKPYTPKISLKDAVKNVGKGYTTSQVRGLLDVISDYEEEPKKKK